jgi:hypothetical protein
MGLFGKLLKTGFDVITSPVEIIKDVATLGGTLTDNDCGQRGSYTERHLRKLADDSDEIREELDKI